jgi:hypothetical protein
MGSVNRRGGLSIDSGGGTVEVSRGANIVGLHTNTTANQRSRAVFSRLKYTSVRTQLFNTATKPNGPSDTPDYTRAVNAATRAAALVGFNGYCSVMCGMYPWKWNTLASVDFGATWEWYTMFPSDTGGEDPNCWGGAMNVGNGSGTNGTTTGAYFDVALDTSATLTNFRAVAALSSDGGLYGAYPRCRFPKSAWPTWLGVLEATMQAFADAYEAAGGDPDKIIWELGNEMSRGEFAASTCKLDAWAVAYLNYMSANVTIPAGYLATDAFMGHVVPPGTDWNVALAAGKAFFLHTLAAVADKYTIRYADYDLVNAHLYLTTGAIDGQRVNQWYARINDWWTYAYDLLQTRGVVGRRGVPLGLWLSEWGVDGSLFNGSTSIVYRGTMIEQLDRRFTAGFTRYSPSMPKVHFRWTIGPDGPANGSGFGDVTSLGEPVGHLAALYALVGASTTDSSGNDPATSRSYIVAAADVVFVYPSREG